MSPNTDQERKGLKNIKAGIEKGPDCIKPRLLKSCAGKLCGIVEHIFNLCLKLEGVQQLHIADFVHSSDKCHQQKNTLSV